MHLPAPIYMLEVVAVVGDAANPESGAELRAEVAAVVEALKAATQADRLVHPAPILKLELEKEALRHLHLEVGALIVRVHTREAKQGQTCPVKSRGARRPRGGPLLLVHSDASSSCCGARRSRLLSRG
jgi:hypothetical protein